MDYDYDYGYGGGDFFGPTFWILGIVYLIVFIVILASLWKIYTKAGKPGWAGIVPIYNLWVLLEIVGRPSWWFWMFIGGAILSMIPILNFLIAIGLLVISIMIMLDLAKSFGKGGGYVVGMIFLPFIFYPILGFGSAQYLGPSASQGQIPTTN